MIRSSDDKIKRLKEELWFARKTIIELLPGPFSDLFRGYYSCNNRSESIEWMNNLLAEIIENTSVIESPHSYFGDTARCPLCGATSSDPYRDGFTFPEGLRRHLEGYGNTHQCSVMREVEALVWDYWNEQFAEQEQKEKEEEHRLRQERMKTEILYISEPFGEAELLDGRYSWSDSRNEEGIQWAEGRLEILGFNIHLNGRMKTYIKEYDDLVVYSDPRTDKKIDFRVFSKPLPKRRPSRGLYKYNVGHFSFQDTWKHNLPEKFEKRINDIREKKQR